MTDPVADKSGFLKMYMSGHPDTLVAYAKWYGKVKEPITSAEMSAIDTKSMTLTCSLKDGNKKVVRVVLDPPLSGYDDVKPRLLEMKALAQEGLGMIKLPIFSTLNFPVHAVLTTTFIPACLIIYTCAFPFYSAWLPAPSSLFASTSPLFAPARFVAAHVPGPFLTFMWAGMLSTHVVEALWVLSLVRKHAGNFTVGAGYVLGTLAFGVPVLQDLRKRIQAARIESVMKIQ